MRNVPIPVLGEGMTVSKITFDRREYKRLKAHEGTYAVLKPHANSSKLGNIIDISKGGLSFHFIDTNKVFSHFSELDIYISGSGLMVSQLPFEITSEITLSKDIPFYSVITRRFGVKFGAISEKAKSQLDHFLHNHTIFDILPDNSA